MGNLEKKTRFFPLFCHSINSCQVYCGLFQNRGDASTSYVLHVRFAATEPAAKTPQSLERNATLHVATSAMDVQLGHALRAT